MNPLTETLNIDVHSAKSTNSLYSVNLDDQSETWSESGYSKDPSTSCVMSPELFEKW